MPERGLKEILQRLGIRQAELARLIEVSPRTVSLWATGASPLPGPVAAYLRVLEASGFEAKGRELKHLEERGRRLDEGIYGLAYAGEHEGDVDSGDALAVLRNGKILGSDRWGGVFTGSYEYDAEARINRVHVRLEVPPEGVLVTGFAAGPRGAMIDVVACFERAAPRTEAMIDIAGRPVEIKLTYLGPVPN
jgi:transcriptional regulator with XRE-family HTH domain